MKRMILTGMIALMVLCSPGSAAADPGSELPFSERKPILTSVSSYGVSRIRLIWERVAGADGYEIYRASSKNGTYRKIGTVTDPEDTDYINTNRVCGETYYYRIRAYRMRSGKKTYTRTSRKLGAFPKPSRVKGLQRLKTTGGFSLEWEKVKGATGYQARISFREEDGSWSEWSAYDRDRDGERCTFRYTTKLSGSSKPCQATIDAHNDGRNFRFRVRAYHTVNGRKICGSWSEVIYARPNLDWKRLGEEMETYIRCVYPEFHYYTENAAGERLTPDNSGYTGFGEMGSISLYASYEDAIREIRRAVDRYITAHGMTEGCFFIEPVPADGYRLVANTDPEARKAGFWMLY